MEDSSHTMKKQCFLVHLAGDEDFNLAVVAENRNRAKAIAMSDAWFVDVDYVDLRAKQVNAQIADLEIGAIIYGVDGLKRGCYEHVHDWCPFHPETRPELVTLWMEDGEIVCDCLDGIPF